VQFFSEINKRYFQQLIFGVIFVLTLNACTPLVQTPNSSSQLPLLTQHLFTTQDGVKLSVKKWLPVNSPKALLVALHGFNDYKNAFAWPATFLAENGIATIAYDQRGFGDAPQRGIWPGRALLERDAVDMIKLVQTEYPDTPIYLFGVSMGAAVALSASVTYDQLNVKGLILVAPAVWGGESFNWFYRSALWFGSHIARGFLTGRGYVTLSDNVEMIRLFQADPKVIPSSRLDAVYGMSQLMDYVQHIAKDNNKPVYLFYGLKDEVISIQAVCLLLKKLTSPFEVHFYPEGYHFLLRDLNREMVWNDILHSVNITSHRENTKDAPSSLIPSECTN